MDKLHVVMKAGGVLDWFVDDVEAREYALANDASVFVFENTSWPHRAEEETPCWNDAPKDATHWRPEAKGFDAAWLKVDRYGVAWWDDVNGTGWRRPAKMPHNAVPRPASQVAVPDERKNSAPPAMIADCLYQAGYEDAKKERDYNPRACVEWQVAVDAMSAPDEREIARPGYAGVTVWIGDQKCTQIVDRTVLETSRADELLRGFENARYLLRAGKV